MHPALRRALSSRLVRGAVVAVVAALVVVAPSSGRTWGGGGSSRGDSSSSGSSGGWGDSSGGGWGGSSPAPGAACQPTNQRLNVSFNTPGCFSCHGQATPAIPAQPIPAGVGAFVLPAGTYVPGVPMQVGAQQAVIPAEPPHPTCTDPNARCPQIAFVHHVSQLGPSCTVCHQVAPGSPGGITVETNCLACHTPNGSVSMAGVSRPGHAVDTHRFVRDSCGRCHPEPVPAIHASAVGGSGRGDSGGGWGGGGGGWGGGGFSATPAGQTAACFFCHVNFPQVVAAGLQAGCSACSNCHDGGDGRGGDGRGGSSRR